MRRLFPLLPLFLLVCACGPSAADVAAEFRDRADAKIAKVRTTGKKAADEKAALKAPDLKEKLTFKSSGANCATAHAELFSEPKGKPQLDLILGDMWLTEPQDALKDPGKRDAEALRLSFENLVALKYLAVVRTVSVIEPVHMGEKNFSPGSWSAEVLLYDIEKGELLGGWAVEAKNSDKVNVNMSGIDKWLHSNLWENARKAINEKLKPHCAEGHYAVD